MKKKYSNKFSLLLLCSTLALCPVAKAQPDVTLEDFLNQEEPSQTDLQPNATEQPQQTDIDIIEDVAVPTDDALPQVPEQQLRIKLQNDDFAAEVGDYDDIQALNPNVKSQAELAEEIRRDAFNAALTGLFPLKPSDIRAVLKEYDKTRRAVEDPVHGIPTPQIDVQTISLDPGVAPMALKTATGHITTLNILDITGAPWPIQDVSWAGDFEIIEPEEGGHIIRITPMSQSAYGNMSIRLLTLKTPVTIMLSTSKDEVQYRVDARIPEYGPFAQASLIDGGSERVAGNNNIMSILDGTPPNGSIELDVSGVDGRTRAYKVNGLTYVRTPLTLLSPGWEQSVSSADGMNVYAMADTPVLLLSDNGRFVRANVRNKESLFDNE